jgi:hypothetical protein
MGAFLSVFQGLMFAGFSTFLMGSLGIELTERHGADASALPRILVGHFFLSFALGIVSLKSMVTRIHPSAGVAVGPLGTFLVTALSLFLLNSLALVFSQPSILLLLPLAVSYTIGLAERVHHDPARIQGVFAWITICVASSALFLRTPDIDNFTNESVRAFWPELADNGTALPASYIASPGGPAGNDWFTFAYACLCSAVLLAAQIGQIPANQAQNGPQPHQTHGHEQT